MAGKQPQTVQSCCVCNYFALGSNNSQSYETSCPVLVLSCYSDLYCHVYFCHLVFLECFSSVFWDSVHVLIGNFNPEDAVAVVCGPSLYDKKVIGRRSTGTILPSWR